VGNPEVVGKPAKNGIQVVDDLFQIHGRVTIRYRVLRYVVRLPTRNALAIRIAFPLIGAAPVSYTRPSLPVPLGKQQEDFPIEITGKAFRFSTTPLPSPDPAGIFIGRGWGRGSSTLFRLGSRP